MLGVFLLGYFCGLIGVSAYFLSLAIRPRKCLKNQKLNGSDSWTVHLEIVGRSVRSRAIHRPSAQRIALLRTYPKLRLDLSTISNKQNLFPNQHLPRRKKVALFSFKFFRTYIKPLKYAEIPKQKHQNMQKTSHTHQKHFL